MIFRFDYFSRFNVIYLIYDFNDILVLEMKITCSMRLSARRANDSRRPELLAGIVGGNGGVDILNVYCMLFIDTRTHRIWNTVAHKFIALLKLLKGRSIDLFCATLSMKIYEHG